MLCRKRKTIASWFPFCFFSQSKDTETLFRRRSTERARAFTHNSTALLYVCIIAQGTQGTNFFFTRVTESRIKEVNELLCTQLVHNLTVQTVPIVMRERHMQVLSSILCKVTTAERPQEKTLHTCGLRKKNTIRREQSRQREFMR